GMVGMTHDELSQLESFGVVHPRTTGGAPVYDEDAVAVAKPAAEFLRAGIDARHLRNWRTSAEREASLYEQIVTPRFRQRNPEARAEALQQLRRLDALGASLRTAMTRQALRHHFDG
ncbi:MAG: MerR family transcriptional regulator, partial [Acidimicrobiia bacterium]